MQEPFRVSFVCLGNICRSPMAASVFRALVRDAELDDRVRVDSAGTGGWHVGDGADRRATAALQRRGYPLGHVARQFLAGDFDRFDLVLALDAEVLADLRHLSRTPSDAERVQLLRAFDAAADGDLVVPDPYYGTGDDFDQALDLIEPACAGLLEHVRRALRV